MADFSTPSNLAARFLDAAGCGKTIFAGQLKKISEASEGNGVLEHGNIGILGFKRIHPSFHLSTTPIFITLERGD
jgi:hypothetical protein